MPCLLLAAVVSSFPSLGVATSGTPFPSCSTSASGECNDDVGPALHLLQASQRAKAKVPRAWTQDTLATAADIKLFLEQDNFEESYGVSKAHADSLLNCALVTCLNILNRHRQKACGECLQNQWETSTVGVNHVAISYMVDATMWPGCDNRTGICNDNMAQNYTGLNTTSYYGYDSVKKFGSQLPKMEWAGQWWRGCELGYLIQSPYFWSGSGIDPISIVLGITPAQHAAIRPLMMKMWGQKQSEVQAVLDEYTKKFFEERQDVGLAVPNDIIAFVHKLLNKVTFNREVSTEDANDFVSLQNQVVMLGTAGTAFTPPLFSFLGPIRKKVTKYIDEYETLIKAQFGDELKNEDCSPSPSCSRQLAVAVWDTFYAAGGLSVPTTISTGVATLFSKDSSNPAIGISYTPDEAEQFYWENLRYYAPVVGFPHWTVRPVCPGLTAEETAALSAPNGKSNGCPLGKKIKSQGYPEVNQYMGGHRTILDLKRAQHDPSEWGATAGDFVIRPLAEYNKSVGFAEMAVDNSVAHGRMNRMCPGKELAVAIGTTFFKHFNKSDWIEPCDGVTFTHGPKYVNPFTLQTKKMAADCKKNPPKWWDFAGKEKCFNDCGWDIF